jgi:hypothetical protein
LLKNAVEAVPAGGWTRLSLQADHTSIEVAVEDSGPVRRRNSVRICSTRFIPVETLDVAKDWVCRSPGDWHASKAAMCVWNRLALVVRRDLSCPF